MRLLSAEPLLATSCREVRVGEQKTVEPDLYEELDGRYVSVSE